MAGAGPKLPVWRTVAEAYGYVWRQRSVFSSLAFPAVTVIAILSALLTWGTGRGENVVIEGVLVAARPGWTLVLAAVLVVVGNLAYIVFSVAWHRRFLVAAAGTTVGQAYVWRARQTRFLIATLKLAAALIPVAAVLAAAFAVIGGIFLAATAQAPPGAGFQRSAFAAFLATPAFALVLWWVIGRFSMIFPAAAIDDRMSFTRSWRLTEGNGWRLVVIFFGVSLPLLAAGAGLRAVLALIPGSVELYSVLSLNLIGTLAFQVFTFFGIALGVSVLSISYLKLTAAADDG